ncbi:carbohydrate ABC transporter permease [Longispora sp. NPDC051575]|uniref:carbohydrate ABC transporter permease n=1 Tax=Longispora sp. NPDC051575 TaxID=3154943 RepID=UPI0034310720
MVPGTLPRARRRLRWWNGVIAAVLCAVFLTPYLWMVGSSLKSQDSIFKDASGLSIWTFLPHPATLDNYVDLFVERDLGRAMLNSLLVSAAQVVCTVIVCSLAAYALTRIDFRGRTLLFGVILTTFLVPSEALVVPMYHVATQLGLNDSLWGVFVPWIASPFGIFLLRQAFLDVPRELDEAAMLDGAGHWRIFRSIMLPNVRTALATLALITFLASWNAFLWPLVIAQSPENQVIQVAIAQNTVPGELPNWGVVFAGATLATIPIMVLFMFLQKYFVEGMARSGLKG